MHKRIIVNPGFQTYVVELIHYPSNDNPWVSQNFDNIEQVLTFISEQCPNIREEGNEDIIELDLKEILWADDNKVQELVSSFDRLNPSIICVNDDIFKIASSQLLFNKIKTLSPYFNFTDYNFDGQYLQQVLSLIEGVKFLFVNPYNYQSVRPLFQMLPNLQDLETLAIYDIVYDEGLLEESGEGHENAAFSAIIDSLKTLKKLRYLDIRDCDLAPRDNEPELNGQGKRLIVELVGSLEELRSLTISGAVSLEYFEHIITEIELITKERNRPFELNFSREIELDQNKMDLINRINQKNEFLKINVVSRNYNSSKSHNMQYIAPHIQAVANEVEEVEEEGAAQSAEGIAAQQEYRRNQDHGDGAQSAEEIPAQQLHRAANPLPEQGADRRGAKRKPTPDSDRDDDMDTDDDEKQQNPGKKPKLGSHRVQKFDDHKGDRGSNH